MPNGLNTPHLRTHAIGCVLRSSRHFYARIASRVQLGDWQLGLFDRWLRSSVGIDPANKLFRISISPLVVVRLSSFDNIREENIPNLTSGRDIFVVNVRVSSSSLSSDRICRVWKQSLGKEGHFRIEELEGERKRAKKIIVVGIILLLMANRGAYATRSQLIERVWMRAVDNFQVRIARILINDERFAPKIGRDSKHWY